jgi:hypothetical protein
MAVSADATARAERLGRIQSDSFAAAALTPSLYGPLSPLSRGW